VLQTPANPKQSKLVGALTVLNEYKTPQLENQVKNHGVLYVIQSIFRKENVGSLIPR
jgi:hypothetical protein